MSETVLTLFGELKENTPDSIYTYANSLTLDIMGNLAEDTRFLDCNQADVLNLALILLCGFLHNESNKVGKEKLHDFIEDYNEFKDFAMFTMNTCRANNVAYNDAITDLIKAETSQ